MQVLEKHGWAFVFILEMHHVLGILRTEMFGMFEILQQDNVIETGEYDTCSGYFTIAKLIDLIISLIEQFLTS